MEASQFIQVGLPVSLAFIMFSLGLTLRVDAFRQQLAMPRATVIGLLTQLLAVPLLALTVVKLLQLPPAIAVGLMILSFCPGGVTSNWFSHIAKANVPLSISLTVLASLITPFTIPLLSEYALQVLLADERTVHIPLGLTMTRLFIISVIPVTLGMLILSRFSAFARRWQPAIYRFATLLFMLVIAVMIMQQWAKLPNFLALSGTASLAMILMGMLSGTLIAKYLGLSSSDKKTLTIEVGMQNGGMALVVTQGVLQSTTLSIVPVVYGLLMLLPITLYSHYAQR